MKKLGSYIFILCCIFAISLKTTKAINVKSEEGQYLIKNTDPNDYYIDENGEFQYTDAYLESQKDSEFLESEQFLGYGLDSLNSINILLIPKYKQETSYWCGPANALQVIDYFKKSNLTQQQLATEMGTTTESTIVYRIKNALNNHQSVHTYTYTQMTSSSMPTFTNILLKNIIGVSSPFVGAPIILHADTKALPLYNGNSLYHYLTVNGFDSENAMVTYVDTYYRDYGLGSVLGQHQIYLGTIFQTISNSRYVIH